MTVAELAFPGQVTEAEIKAAPVSLWDSLNTEQATFEVQGSQLEREKWGLLGIPFIVLSVHFQSPTETRPRGYVTLETVIAPKDVIEQQIKYGRVPMGLEADAFASFDAWHDRWGIEPGAPLLFNDGSTGIRREIVEMLHLSGLINVGFSPTERKDEGRFVFDRPFTEWADSGSLVQVGSGETARMEPHFDNAGKAFIKVHRGLRVSKKDEESKETFSLS
jgi:hypothetical protein